jgi:hypothetical protein
LLLFCRSLLLFAARATAREHWPQSPNPSERLPTGSRHGQTRTGGKSRGGKGGNAAPAACAEASRPPQGPPPVSTGREPPTQANGCLQGHGTGSLVLVEKMGEGVEGMRLRRLCGGLPAAARATAREHWPRTPNPSERLPTGSRHWQTRTGGKSRRGHGGNAAPAALWPRRFNPALPLGSWGALVTAGSGQPEGLCMASSSPLSKSGRGGAVREVLLWVVKQM